MSILRQLLLVLLAVHAGLAFFADDTAIDIPDPTLLASDWWLYFEPKDPLTDSEQLARLDNANRFYGELRKRLNQSGDTRQAQLLGRFLDDLKRFFELSNTAGPVPEPASPATDSYTIEAALQLFEQSRALQQAINAEGEEIAWLSTVLKERRRLQSRLRGKYLEMEKQSPERLDEGLDLMQRRIGLELQRIELERRKLSVKQEQERLDRLQIRLSGISKLLVSGPDEKLFWEKASLLLRQHQHERATGKFIIELLDSQLTAREGWIRQNLIMVSDRILEAGSTAGGLMSATLFEINETPVTTMGLLRVVLILFIALWLSRIVRRAIQHIGERRSGWNQSSLYTFGRLLHYLILIIGIIIGLSTIGIDFTKFALFASALGVGIGFGLQTLISNFVAGLIILFEKSLKVGDFVELESGVTGEVKEINMRSTLITTNDNIDILAPNSEFVGGRVINWTLREAYRRIRVPFGVAYGTDKEQVRKAALEAAENVQWTLQTSKARKPQVWFVELGDSSLNFELVIWLTPDAVKRPGAVMAAYLWEIETKLGEYGIEVPFPQRDLHLRSAFGLRDDAALGIFTNPEKPETGNTTFVGNQPGLA